MHSRRLLKMREFLVPVAFAILWGLLAVWLHGGSSIP